MIFRIGYGCDNDIAVVDCELEEAKRIADSIASPDVGKGQAIYIHDEDGHHVLSRAFWDYEYDANDCYESPDEIIDFGKRGHFAKWWRI